MMLCVYVYAFLLLQCIFETSLPWTSGDRGRRHEGEAMNELIDQATMSTALSFCVSDTFDMLEREER